MSIKVQGLDEAIRSLSKYSKEVQIDTAKAMNTSMLAVQSKAKLSVRKNGIIDTGRLRSSIVTTKATQTELVARTEVGVNYAPYIEFGTGAYASEYLSSQDVEMQQYAMQFYVNGRGRLPSRPFLFPAWESERPKFEQAVKELLQR